MRAISHSEHRWLIAIIPAALILLSAAIAMAQTEGEEPSPAANEVLPEATDGAAVEPVQVAKYDYFILHSLDPDMPIDEWDIVARIPADSSYAYEEPVYFGFFLEDPVPEEPMPPVEPEMPIEPDKADYLNHPQVYKELQNRHREAVADYKKDLIGYSKYKRIYPRLLEKYNAEMETFNEAVYPNLEHYYFFEKEVPQRHPKRAIYELSITQAIKGPLIEETALEETSGIPSALEGISEEPPPLPDDLELPNRLWIEDRPNDAGGAITLRWSTSPSDKIYATYLPESVEEEDESPAPDEVEPEYDMHRFIVNAWLFAPEDELNIPDEIGRLNVEVNLSPMGGDRNAKLKFIGIADDPVAYDYGLGLHFQGIFTIENPIIGRHLIRAVAEAEGMRTRSGKVRVNVVVGEPVDASNTEDRLLDNYYAHYFKLGVDLWDHEGHPRWVIPQQPLGMVAKHNPWDWSKWNSFLFAVLYTVAILGFIFRARKGARLFVRRIAGLDHVEEAIGRATEMGKPVLYVPGLGYMEDVATIAAVNILGQLSRKIAEYECEVLVPCCNPIVMTVCQETVQESYIDAGHPDAFKRENIYYLTDDQFSYVASVDGIMVRQKPSTIFLMGLFFAESLILAETGAGVGAIQIAGTDALAQLPFLITACDYTLIGEELYAASAYLSHEPLLLGSLKGQDLAKLIIIIMLIVGIALATAGSDVFAKLFSSPQ